MSVLLTQGGHAPGDWGSSFALKWGDEQVGRRTVWEMGSAMGMMIKPVDSSMR
jgi:hypothetical protein